MPVYRISHPARKSFFSELSINTKIILINVSVFIIVMPLFLAGLISIDSFAIQPKNILQGKYLWTFLTSMFMHANFLHLFVNMLSLFFIGGLIEKILGVKRYLWFYLISGFFSGLFFVLVSYSFNYDLGVYAVGASGALFALVGLLMLLTPDLPVYVMFIPIPIKMKYAAPGLLIVLWLISIGGNIPIGNVAHLGGLIAGLTYGIYLRTKFKRKSAYIRKMFS